MLPFNPKTLFTLSPDTRSPSSIFATILQTVIQTRWTRLSPFSRSLNPSTPSAPQTARRSRSSDRQRSYIHEGTSITPWASRSTSPRAPSTPQDPDDLEWKYAIQGHTMLSTALSESQTHPTLSRQLYIHALIYLLQALPTNLTDPETSNLRRACPGPILHRHEPPSNSPGLVPTCCPASTFTKNPQLPQRPSRLHRLCAWTIVHIFVLAQRLAPYITCVMRLAYRYERQHRVTERAVVFGIEAADALGRKAAGVASVVLWRTRRDGRVAELLVGGVGWWVDGICGGVQEGVGVGMEMIGERRRG